MNNKTNFQSKSIAKAFIRKLGDRGINASGFKLIKLIYVSHRAMLARFGMPLVTTDSFAIWKYGPTLELLHVDLKIFEGRYVNYDEIMDWPEAEFSVDVNHLIGEVLDRFGSMPTMDLADFAHKQHLIWKHALKAPIQVMIDINEESCS